MGQITSNEEQKPDNLYRFKDVFKALIDLILTRAQLDDELFLQFNKEPASSNDFDDLFEVRADFG